MKSKPVPESATVAGVATAVELMESEPVAEPPAVGEKTTEAVQLAPAARLPVQPFCATLKGPEAASVTEPMAKLVELVMVTDCAALDWPAAIAAKVSWVGLVVRPLANCAEPLRGIETAATPVVEDETKSAAAMEPVALGVKTICAVQLLPLFRSAPQVVEETE